MKTFKEYSQEVDEPVAFDENFMGYGSDAGGTMWSRHSKRVRDSDKLHRNYLVGKDEYPARKPRQHHDTYNAQWEKHKEELQAKKDADKGAVGKVISKAKVAVHKKIYGIHPTVKEESELDEGMYLVGTYSNPKKEHIRVWQHSPAGYHYSIENTTNKKTLTHHGSLDAAVKKHSLVLNKEEYEPAPNVPRHIRAHANRSGGTHYNILGKLQKKQFTKDKQDHDDEGAIERAAARRKGW